MIATRNDVELDEMGQCSLCRNRPCLCNGVIDRSERQLRLAIEQLARRCDDAGHSIEQAATALHALGASASVVEALGREAAAAREAARLGYRRARQLGGAVLDAVVMAGVLGLAYCGIALGFAW